MCIVPFSMKTFDKPIKWTGVTRKIIHLISKIWRHLLTQRSSTGCHSSCTIKICSQEGCALFRFQTRHTFCFSPVSVNNYQASTLFQKSWLNQASRLGLPHAKICLITFIPVWLFGWEQWTRCCGWLFQERLRNYWAARTVFHFFLYLDRCWFHTLMARCFF